MRMLALAAALLSGCTIGSPTPPAPAPSAAAAGTAGASRLAAPTRTPPAPTATARGLGAISGRLGYPSDLIPPQTLYAIDISAPPNYRVLHTERDQQRFTLAGLAPGPYILVAFVTSDSLGAISGSYTRFVTCGLSASCTDHTPIAVVVRAGETTSDVDVLDWYAPPGTLPARPRGQEPFTSGDRLTVRNPFADEVNLRPAPAIAGRVLTTLANGASVTVTDGPRASDGYDWYLVRSGTTSGWAVGYALRR